jgi:carrier-protein-independent halogenase WelO5-like protein
MAAPLTIPDIIDLDRYPLAGDTAKRATLLKSLKSDLDQYQFCALPNFFRPAALAQVVAEASANRAKANDNNSLRNCYFEQIENPDLPKDHPRNIMHNTGNRMLGYEHVPKGSPIRLFYHWPEIRRMVAEIVGAVQLFENEDPWQPANILIYEPGDLSAWHFDSTNAFTMTMMLQAPDAGGAFELVPNTRTDTDQNYDYVQQILLGKRDQDIVEVGRNPGELCIFRGCNSMHRVSEVKGTTRRIMGVFVYEDKPGVIGDPVVNATVYGV